MSRRIDVSLYAIIDEDCVGGRNLGTCASELVRAGASVVQYRAKNLSSREFLLKALSIESAIRGSGVPLVINDRADIALLSGASGVHLGSDDIPPEKARQLLGPDRIIGVTVHDVQGAIRAEREGADYLGAASVFPTSTKGNVPLIGLGGLKDISSSVKIPVVAIGGLTLKTVGLVIEAGADGLAFISELWKNREPGKRAGELRAAIDSAYRLAR
ncbi:MAG: thiamine phosphate synthase [Candidatus Eisenbacteria bacterium]|nr:thiamine phosphate synthase [Candidatus Eisenbacteria bacterium]